MAILYLLLAALFSKTIEASEQKKYPVIIEPIDVVIPCVKKDLETLDYCIEGIRKNVQNVRRIIIVSSSKLTDKAEWFDEKKYPFQARDLALEIFHDPEKAAKLSTEPSRLGWIYQQFLKMYAPLVIPDISSNVLIVDADTIFLNPVKVLSSKGEGLYNYGNELHPPYFEHMGRLIPGLKRFNARYSGVCHHMLFQRAVIDDLFQTITKTHQMEPWKAMCRCIDPAQFNGSSMSEYEIYFNYIFTKTDQMQVRPLKWKNISKLKKLARYKKAGYHYVSCHAYSREK